MRLRIYILIPAVLLLMCFNCLAETTDEEEKTSHLDWALNETGSSRLSHSVPEPWEFGYLTGARMPVLVDTLTNPFYIPPFSQVFGARFSGSRGVVSPSTLLENTFDMLNLDTSFYQALNSETMSPVDALEKLQAEHHRGLIESAYREELSLKITQWPTELQEAVTILIQAMTQASLQRQEALKKLSSDEINKVIDDVQKWISDPAMSHGICFQAGVDRNWPTDLELLRKIDYSKLMFASKIMAEAIEYSRTRLEAAREKIDVMHHDHIMLQFHSAIGTIIVGGMGINRYENDAALIIDIGGNDVYRNNAGGFIDSNDGICCLIDMDGNDIYSSQRSGSIGSALCGISFLIDYDGHDTYLGGNLSQGSAFCGVAMMYDESGDDSWIGESFTQGAAAFGIGLAVDVGGNDSINCKSIGQGFGTTLGAGVLINVSGNDSYCSGPLWHDSKQKKIDVSCLTQGAGAGFQSMDVNRHLSLFGGVGFLVDGHGSDQYIAGNMSQGYSRFAAMGILLDCDGNDGYQAGSFSQGMALDWSSACLIDQHGNDWYEADDTAQGSGINCSSGLLLDYNGDDRYTINGTHGQGYSRERYSLGLFIDYKGYDLYRGGPFTRGFNTCLPGETHCGSGIFIDHRGKDTYDSIPFLECGNNTHWKSSPGGFGLDTPDTPVMYFAHEQAMSRHQHYDMSPVIDLEVDTEMSKLGSVDPYVTFHALDFFTTQGIQVLPVAVKAMQRGHDSFRRIMEEGLACILLENSSSEKTTSALLALIHNLDPSSRQWAIQQLTAVNISILTDLLPVILSDSDASVRKTGLIAATYLKNNQHLEIIQNIALEDSSPENRKLALSALQTLWNSDDLSVFRQALTDKNYSVYYEARKQILERKDLDSIGALQLLTSSSDNRFKLSASKALIILGSKSGFPVLLDALKTEKKVHSPHDKSQKLIDFLKEYSGQNLPDQADAWQNWWITSEATFNLQQTLTARNSFNQCLDKIPNLSPYQTLLQINEIRKKYPDYHGFDTKLSPWLIIKAKGALTTKSTKTALNLSKLAVELTPENPEAWSILSETQFARSMIDNALTSIIKAIERAPDNKHYRKLRDIYRNADTSNSPERK